MHLLTANTDNFLFLNTNILSFSTAIKRINILKKQKIKCGYLSGIFDMLHIGHINYLTIAKNYCDTLFVGMETTETLKAIKKVPTAINSYENRLQMMLQQKSVDYVVRLDSSLNDYNSDASFEIQTQRYVQLNPDVIIIPDRTLVNFPRQLSQIEKAEKALGKEFEVVEILSLNQD
ncbi:adenylyltransferase/cytidyltransferase family protein [Candidatus Nomurabacteria bacterium]|uniref:Adenylyltransferase/cytidyltransferase family protein n=1 Tax=candidate division WWE3 bacterium TaxID=2053526 RepID=A0A955E0K4_UNCKA|nr:adenylyltransferase/cytidyltransferase family protein [candidate division WWE3 bacterium]MCB9823670.1 adenylyltransferase/cytidyltransferase family protein [Candidatus Nomurabacteria bacterium]MCB9827252.1 adenylyltransferase/cytidyltransferase family protein [Candidatus Nomurabacteria bacterium]MCB9827465.1 adenylyltransferase/cytidyltransferase family protein [Candidatus Nomurabacteria bacterium]HXK52587.1 adenylyltransferase/cytidyltransferase family protein [bacterium]